MYDFIFRSSKFPVMRQRGDPKVSFSKFWYGLTRKLIQGFTNMRQGSIRFVTASGKSFISYCFRFLFFSISDGL